MSRFDILLFTILVICSFDMRAQIQPSIENPQLNLADNKLIIAYNIVNYITSDRYNIWIEITGNSGSTISARSLAGDIGFNLKGGPDKQIIWDLEKDSIYLDEEISVKVIAELIPILFNKPAALGLSVIYPGWGLTKIHKRRPYWLLGIAGYGSLAGSVVLNQNASNNYDKYLNSIDISESESLYNLSTKQNNSSKYLAYASIGIWAIDILWVALTPVRGKELKSGSSGGWTLTPGITDFKDPVMSIKYMF